MRRTTGGSSISAMMRIGLWHLGHSSGFLQYLPSVLAEPSIHLPCAVRRGDGTLMLGVARALADTWPSVELRLLDRQDLVQPATLAGFEIGRAHV